MSGEHILVFPYPAQGHMLPLLDFSHHLAVTVRGLTITILVTPKNLPLLKPLLSTHPNSIIPLVLPFPTHPAIPPGVENTVELPAGGFRSMMCALEHLHNPILHWFRHHPSPPVAIVSDMFLGWTNKLASQLNIHRYAFFPSGVFAMSFINSLWREMPQRVNIDDDNETVGFPEIPNSPIYPWWQLSPVYRSYVKEDPNSELIRDGFMENMKSYGLVFNTFDGLEKVYLDYLVKKLGHDRIWSIGPLLPPQNVGPTSVLATEICSWLDKCEDASVVYVCFGSQAVLKNKQMNELCSGLEKSGVKFILSVKGATKGHEEEEGRYYGRIPVGFEDRVAGRGLVIKGWAPQVLILQHRAVCSFLSHCGWNSTLESILAGVPMLAWPMGADQYLNANLVVDQLEIGIRVCQGAKKVFDSQELVKILSDQVRGENWKARKSRAMDLSKAALNAIKQGGTSFNSFEGLARSLNCSRHQQN